MKETVAKTIEELHIRSPQVDQCRVRLYRVRAIFPRDRGFWAAIECRLASVLSNVAEER